MKAMVTKADDGKITVSVPRNLRKERVQGRHYDVKVGDKIEVMRQANNPCLARVFYIA